MSKVIESPDISASSLPCLIGTASKLLVIALAVGGYCLVLAHGKGNQLIPAGPLALWGGILAWPRSKSRQPGSSKENRKRKKGTVASPVASPVLLGIRFLGCAAIWVALGMTVVPRIADRSLSEGEVDVLMKKANDLLYEGDPEGALLAYRALRIPQHLSGRIAESHHNCGVILLEQGWFEEAKLEFREAVRHDPEDKKAIAFVRLISASLDNLYK